jgi:hypothetical protein
MGVSFKTMPVATTANLPCGTLYAWWLATILAQNLETVTLYHTIPHFSTLFYIVPLTVGTIAQGGEIYFTLCYTFIHDRSYIASLYACTVRDGSGFC